jgi:hypothetical protein
MADAFAGRAIARQAMADVLADLGHPSGPDPLLWNAAADRVRQGQPPELAGLLARLAYKPGWHFELAPNRSSYSFGGISPFQWMLVISVDDVLDSRGSGTRSSFVTTAPVPDAPEATREYYTHWLWDQILQAERHEAGEWFVVDGTRPYDPHA